MSDDVRIPFEDLRFWMIRGSMPRESLSLSADGEGAFTLHVQKGSAANPTFQFTRTVPRETAARLNSALLAAGVAGWEESYGDVAGAPALRWGLSIVFKKDVFSQASRGGSATPAGFDMLLEELYRLDFPRPSAQSEKPKTALATSGLPEWETLGRDLGLDLGGLGLDQLEDVLGSGELEDLMRQTKGNPYLLQAKMREEFSRMSPYEQEQLLDRLTATGLASRAYWERWLRG